MDVCWDIESTEEYDLWFKELDINSKEAIVEKDKIL